MGGGWTVGGRAWLLSGGNWGGLREVGDPKKYNSARRDTSRVGQEDFAEAQAEKNAG